MEPCACEGSEGAEGLDCFAVACGEAAEVFEFVEAPFDSVALFVEFAVVRPLQLAVTFGWDYRRRTHSLRTFQQEIGIVSAVGEDGLGMLTFQQLSGGRIFAGLPCSDAELQRQAGFVSQQVDLGA